MLVALIVYVLLHLAVRGLLRLLARRRTTVWEASGGPARGSAAPTTRGRPDGRPAPH